MPGQENNDHMSRRKSCWLLCFISLTGHCF